MAMVSDDAFPSFYWRTTGRAGLKLWRNTKQKWHIMRPQIKRKRGKQHGVNLLVMPGVPKGLEGGPRRA